MKRQGFTLVELLAVIVILAIVLAIAVPSITGIIDKVTKNAFEIDAKNIIKSINYKLLQDENFDIANINEETIATELNISNVNYEKISILINDGKPYITIIGKNKWDRLLACGGSNELLIGTVDAPPLACTISFDLVAKFNSNYYVGADPNNWIEFGQVSEVDSTPLLWRIIRSDNEGIKIIYEGKKQGSNPPNENGRVKIDNYYSVKFDNEGNNWNEGVSISSKLINWYNNLYVENKEAYLRPIKWCVGAVSYVANLEDLSAKYCSNQIYNDVLYSGRTSSLTAVGLISVVDYIAVSSDEECHNSSSTRCGKLYEELGGSTLYYLNNVPKTNFLNKDYFYWTSTANGYDPSSVHMVGRHGNLAIGCFGTNCILKGIGIDEKTPNEFNIWLSDGGVFEAGIIDVVDEKTGKTYIEINDQVTGNELIYNYIAAGFSENIVLLEIIASSIEPSAFDQYLNQNQVEPFGQGIFNLRPVLNLKNDVIVIDGDGTLETPYKLK